MRKAKFTFAVLLSCTIFSIVLVSCGDDKTKTDTMVPVVVDTTKIDTATPMPVKTVN